MNAVIPRKPRSSGCTEAAERLVCSYSNETESIESIESTMSTESTESTESGKGNEGNESNEVSEINERNMINEVKETRCESLPSLQGKTVAIVDVGFSNKDFVSAAISAGGGHAIADEIWAIDEMGGVLMHHRAFSMRPLECRPNWDWPKEHPGPLYCSIKAGKEDEEAPFPGCFGYPLRQAIHVLGVPYLTSSAAYALAYAIGRGVKTVKLYGIDALEVRPCIEYLICKALHRGISVQIGASSNLMDSSARPEDKLYGFRERGDPPVPRVVDDKLTIKRRFELQ